MPELKLDPAAPVPVKRVLLPPAARTGWYMKAVYPVPYGTVWLRYSESSASPSKEYLEIITPEGRLLQRAALDPSPSTKVLASEARYLEPTRARGPLLYLKSTSWHHCYAFPDGFSGFLSESSMPSGNPLRFEMDKRGVTLLKVEGKLRRWSGVDFQESSDADIKEGASPRTFPARNGTSRFAGAFFDRFYFLRWVTVGKKVSLEVWDKSGRRLAVHPLHDGFGSDEGWTFLSATWLNEKTKRGPVIIIRDSDQVRVHVFSDGLRRLIAAQDFNDASSSLSATTVSFDRDKNGLMTVTESYSERPLDGATEGASSENNYHWTGKGFS